MRSSALIILLCTLSASAQVTVTVTRWGSEASATGEPTFPFGTDMKLTRLPPTLTLLPTLVPPTLTLLPALVSTPPRLPTPGPPLPRTTLPTWTTLVTPRLGTPTRTRAPGPMPRTLTLRLPTPRCRTTLLTRPSPRPLQAEKAQRLSGLPLPRRPGPTLPRRTPGPQMVAMAP